MALNADKAYLLILIPIIIAAAVFIIKKEIVKGSRYTWVSTVIRIITASFLIMALSGMSIIDKAKDDTTIFLADVSDSTSVSTSKLESFIDSAQEHKKNGDKTAVVAFASRPITVLPTTNEYNAVKLDTPTAGKESTDIESAIKSAATIYDKNTNKRMVLMTDGQETKGDVVSLRNMLKSDSISLLVYDISNAVENEAGVREISLPQYVNLNMDYDVNVVIDSVGSQSAVLRLYRGSTLVVNETISLKNGENRYVFTDKALTGGGITYHAEITPEKDTFYQNNSVYGYCYAQNLPAVLVVGDNESAENMKNILESAQLDVTKVSPSNTPNDYDSLIGYDTVVIADTAYNDLNEDFVNALESYVKYAGGGLITIGGEDAYGMGDYKGTVLEDILPVESEIKTQSEDPDLAMVMVIDRSGSMDDTSQGISCMDIAKEAAYRGIEQLDDNDRVGVISFDTQAQWVVDLTKVGGNLETIGDKIGTIQADGGTSILPALRAACSKLADTDAKVKHIILLTDGQAEQEGYSGLLSMARNDGITISTIAVGNGADTKLLQYIADEGKGRYYFASQFSSLPEIFVYETTVASKDYLNNEDFYPTAVEQSTITDGVDSVPMLHGYVSTTAKSRADVILQSDTEEPVLAVWQYGLGRTAAWTSDLSGQWTNDWLGADEGTQIIRNLVSYTMRSDVLYDVDVSAEAADGVSQITAKIPVSTKTVELSALVLDTEGKEYSIGMTAVSPGEYKGTIPTDKEGAYIITLTEKVSEGDDNVYNTGFILSYPKEYDTRSFTDNGVIDELASYEGISVITSPDEVYSSALPQTMGQRDITVGLVVAAIIALLIDIVLRRFPEITDRAAAVIAKLKPKKKERKAVFETAEQKKSEPTEDKPKTKTKEKAKKNDKPAEEKSSADRLAELKRNRKK